MTDVASWVAGTRAAAGLPRHVEDDAVLEAVVDGLRATSPDPAAHHPPGEHETKVS